MNTPDDLYPGEAEANDASTDHAEIPSTQPIEAEVPKTQPMSPPRKPGLRRLTLQLQESESLAARPTEPMAIIAATPPLTEQGSAPTLPPVLTRMRNWRPARRADRLQDWQSWSGFRLWRHTRPFWGSLCMILAALFMILSAAFFLPLAFLAQSLWPALFVGGLLLAMGIIQLLLPSYNVITGAIGIVLSLVSLLVASFGGCGLGLLLGIIGSALSIAWHPVKRSRLVAQP